MSKVVIDESLCTGCGLCASNCPDLFEVGEDSLAHVKLAGSKTCDLKEAADQCPVTAIIVK